jgi:predicted nucleotidyltransferase
MNNKKFCKSKGIDKISLVHKVPYFMNNKEKILKKIFENPTYKFHVRELARMTRLNPNTIINITEKLKKQDLILKEKNKNLMEIKANIENINFIRQKRIFNIKRLYESKLIDSIIKYYDNPEAIIVFGSYSRGEDIEESDIDLVIITDKKETFEKNSFEKKVKRKLHILNFRYGDWSEGFYKNLINGIILHGYLR